VDIDQLQSILTKVHDIQLMLLDSTNIDTFPPILSSRLNLS